MLDSAIKVSKMYYPQTLLEKCKYEIKKTKVQSLVTGHSDPSSSDESDRSSDNESDNESNNNPDNESDNESKNVFLLQIILCILSLSV